MNDKDYAMMNAAMNNDHHAEVMTIDEQPALIKVRHVDGSVTVQFLRDMREVHYSEVEFLRIENAAFEGRIGVWFDMYGAAKKEADALTARLQAAEMDAHSVLYAGDNVRR